MKLLYSLISSTGGGPSTEAADGDARVTRAQGKATNLGGHEEGLPGNGNAVYSRRHYEERNV